MCIIPKRLMLGLDPERCKMKPLKEHMKEAILEVFNVPINDRDQRKAFDRAWVRKMKKKILTTFNNRRGRFSTSARIELWRLLGVLKSINASQQEEKEWLKSLVTFANGKWFLQSGVIFLCCFKTFKLHSFYFQYLMFLVMFRYVMEG